MDQYLANLRQQMRDSSHAQIVEGYLREYLLWRKSKLYSDFLTAPPDKAVEFQLAFKEFEAFSNALQRDIIRGEEAENELQQISMLDGREEVG